MRRFDVLRALLVALALLAFASAPVAALDETPASELRVTLDRLLSEHAFLTVQAMHAGVTDEDQFSAAADALEENTAELEAAVGSVYGQQGGRRFGDLWRAHIGLVVDYTRAYEAGDEAAQQEALDGIENYQHEFVAFLSGANPHLPEATLHALLEDHLGQLQQVANLQTGDYSAVYGTARDAYHHMFELGDGLSAAIVQQFPDDFSGGDFAFGPAIDLRIALDSLLGEHAFLAAEVMRQGDTSEDAEAAAADALAVNGDAIRAAIADIYGEDAATGFAAIWEQHNGHYVDYVRATLAGDAAGADASRASLEDFSQDIADFFVTATDQAEAADAIQAGLAAHTSHLIDQVDAYQAGDYVTAFAIAREAYQHMGAISDVLATGIANQFPDRFLPNTTAQPPSQAGWVAALAVVLFASLIVLRRTVPR